MDKRLHSHPRERIRFLQEQQQLKLNVGELVVVEVLLLQTEEEVAEVAVVLMPLL
jgi:uncharacterized protein Smg (DUF494 family)